MNPIQQLFIVYEYRRLIPHDPATKYGPDTNVLNIVKEFLERCVLIKAGEINAVKVRTRVSQLFTRIGQHRHARFGPTGSNSSRGGQSLTQAPKPPVFILPINHSALYNISLIDTYNE